MKALLSTAPGGPETLVLGELPAPVAGPGEVLVDVRACAINFPDTLIIVDQYQFRPERPFAPGGEVAGVVAAVGPGVTRVAPGDRVFGFTTHGGMAEQAVVQETKCFRLPAEIDFAVGASLLMTYGTCYHALVDRGAIAAGETLLVLGAAGGIGLATVELGKALGARVVAAVSDDAKAAAARAAGADEVVVYGTAALDKDGTRALAGQFKAACGKDGAAVVADPVGGAYAEPALRSLGWGGRYLVLGFAAGVGKLPMNLPLLKGLDVRGVFWGHWIEREPARFAEEVSALLEMVRDGRIAPRIAEEFPLERGHEAIATLAARKAVGKLIVRIAD